MFPEVTEPGIRTSLNTKIVQADKAYKRGQMNVAANQLHAFLNEIESQSGKAIARQAAAAITSLTVSPAELLGIPVARVEQPR